MCANTSISVRITLYSTKHTHFGVAAEASIRILFIIMARDEQSARKVQNLLSDRRSPSSVVTSPLARARARVATSSLARARAVICTVR
jgi:hypothetical protein